MIDGQFCETFELDTFSSTEFTRNNLHQRSYLRLKTIGLKLFSRRQLEFQFSNMFPQDLKTLQRWMANDVIFIF